MGIENKKVVDKQLKMENKELDYTILEFLGKKGATNTFKLAHVLKIKRDKLLKILSDLEKRGLIRIVTGKAEFLSCPPSKEKKKQKPKVVISKEKSEVQTLQEEVEKQKLYAEKLKAQIKKLEQRPQKVITRTIIKEAKPKVITKTIIKEAKPVKTERKKKRKRKKIKEVKIKPKKIKRSVKLRKKSKKVLGVKKSFKKLGLKIKEGVGIFKIKNFIKNLKKKKRR